MVRDVYIGYAHSKEFDFDIVGPSSGYIPEHAMPNPEENILHGWLGFDLYWAIRKHPQSKSADWGCSVVKMYKEELIDFLIQYNERGLASRAKEYLLNDMEYVIVAIGEFRFLIKSSASPSVVRLWDDPYNHQSVVETKVILLFLLCH